MVIFCALGLYIIGHVRQGQLSDYAMDPLHEDLPYWLSLIDYLKVRVWNILPVNMLQIKAFIDMTMAQSIRDGVHQLVRLSGIGAMKPNTVVIGFADDSTPTNTLEDSKLLKTLKFAKLDRAEVVEYFTGRDFAPQVSAQCVLECLTSVLLAAIGVQRSTRWRATKHSRLCVDYCRHAETAQEHLPGTPLRQTR
jgi:hypothetical protein